MSKENVTARFILKAGETDLSPERAQTLHDHVDKHYKSQNVKDQAVSYHYLITFILVQQL